MRRAHETPLPEPRWSHDYVPARWLTLDRVLARLIEVMRRLRDPDGGCAWDRVQTFETIAPCTIEEAYEVADAIRRVAGLAQVALFSPNRWM
ncbi:MAG: nucleoside triphosphate pyrophosphohydrolase [Alphaproteobacteria bacterium]|nr:nucleoside triphosphate pyrophosphohydrolase [Alphaproteobacteria bacterium]